MSNEVRCGAVLDSRDRPRSASGVRCVRSHRAGRGLRRVSERNKERLGREVLRPVRCGYVLDLPEGRHHMYVVSTGKIRVGESIHHVFDVSERNEERTRCNILHRVSRGNALGLTERRYRMHVVSARKLRVEESILRVSLMPRRSSKCLENREQRVCRVRLRHVLAIARAVCLSRVSARRVFGHSECYRVSNVSTRYHEQRVRPKPQVRPASTRSVFPGRRSMRS